MARRSAADLSLVPMLPGKGRPAPPKVLDQVEARAWNDVIDALPGQWVDAAGQLVLRRVAAQVAIAERVEVRLRDLALMDDDPDALAAEAQLAAMHRDREIDRARADGVTRHSEEPHGAARRAEQVRAGRQPLPAVGNRSQEVRWADPVSNARLRGRSPRPM